MRKIIFHLKKIENFRPIKLRHFRNLNIKPLTDKSVGSDSLRLEKSKEEIFSSEQAEFSPYDKNASFSQP